MIQWHIFFSFNESLETDELIDSKLWDFCLWYVYFYETFIFVYYYYSIFSLFLSLNIKIIIESTLWDIFYVSQATPARTYVELFI